MCLNHVERNSAQFLPVVPGDVSHFRLNLESVHQFGMSSWENINAQFISFKSWGDGLITRLVGKGKV